MFKNFFQEDNYGKKKFCRQSGFKSALKRSSVINVALLLNPSFQWIREYNCSKDSDDTGPVFPILTNHAHSTGLLIYLSSSWFSFTFIFFCLSIFVSMYVFVLVSLCRLSTSVHLSFCVVVLSVLGHLHLGSFNLKIPHLSSSKVILCLSGAL